MSNKKVSIAKLLNLAGKINAMKFQLIGKNERISRLYLKNIFSFIRFHLYFIRDISFAMISFFDNALVLIIRRIRRGQK